MPEIMYTIADNISLQLLTIENKRRDIVMEKGMP